MVTVSVQGKKIALKEGASAKDLALELKLTAPDQAVGVSINGTTLDLSTALQEGDDVKFWSFADKEGKEIFWHTSAHVLAQAVLRLYPNAKLTIGPPIENGFYYDFADLTLSDADFDRIEEEMKRVIAENHETVRSEFKDKKEAIKAFKDNRFKVELIESFEDGSKLTAYKQGEFFDLCRGPHLPNLGKIKAVKILKTSGAYWRGDAKNEMLTRLYAITFPDRALLKDYLFKLEEAKKRDHKVLGPKLDLFSFHEQAPGIPFMHPAGLYIWNQLIDFWRELHQEAGYEEIKTPSMLTKELWEVSGHWEHYRKNMYTSEVEEREFAIKPMNCPGCILFYKHLQHSYREFPMRIAEIGHVHRHEASGALSGLFRVRAFHQDDAHIFMERHQIQEEVAGVLSLARKIYDSFGLTYHFELSTRPKEGTIGTDEDWALATEGLKQALESLGIPYKLNEGDGAFYGPKIDIHLQDALGRSWQCGTIQLDMALPERFKMEYTDPTSSRNRPIMIHRALYGSMERFMGSLIEFFAGKFPLWLSPRQVRILTVADRHAPYASELARRFRKAGIQVEVDATSESVSKKVRDAQMMQVNYMLTVGDKEVEHKSAALRTRDNVVHGELNIDDFLAKIVEEKKSRSLTSPYMP